MQATINRLERLCKLHSQQGGTIFQFNRLYRCEILDLSDAAFERRFGDGGKQWVFNWQGGGYNTVIASDKRVALALAVAMGKPAGGMTVTLVPVPDSFRVVEAAEMNAIDRAYNMD